MPSEMGNKRPRNPRRLQLFEILKISRKLEDGGRRAASTQVFVYLSQSAPEERKKVNARGGGISREKWYQGAQQRGGGMNEKGKEGQQLVRGGEKAREQKSDTVSMK